MSKAAVGGGLALAGGIAGALGGGGSQSTNSQSMSTQSLPDWVQNAGSALYFGSIDGRTPGAQQIAANLQPTSIARVADMTPGQQSLIASLMSNTGSTNPAFAGAGSTLSQLQNYASPTVTPGSIAGTDLSSYMNPYTQNVINSGMTALDQQRKQALNQVGDQAISSGAFGGSRQGVAEGVTNAQSAMQAGQLASQLQAQNFGNAQNLAAQDINTNLQGQAVNANNAISSAGLRANSALGAGQVAAGGQQSYIQGLLAALGGQSMIQQQQQAQNQFQADTQNAANQLPLQQLGILENGLSNAAGFQNKTTIGSGTATTTQGGGSPILQGLSGALGTAGALASPVSGGQSLLASLMGMFGPSAPSDRRVKDDHGIVGRAHGVPIHAFEYSNAPGPVYRGPMAQDIEKSRYADAVHVDPRTGVKVVDQSAVPAKLRMKPVNGLSIDAYNPQFDRRKKKRTRGR